MVSLRTLLAAGLGLLACTQAEAQVCSDYMKCPSGYVCSKTLPGSVMGTCTKGKLNPAAEKEAATCEGKKSKDVCLKLDTCTWHDQDDSCTTRCEARTAREMCERLDLCAWVEKIETCVTKCNTWRSRDTCAKDERCVWLQNYDYCLTKRGADQKKPLKR